MSNSIQNLKDQVGPQLDLTLRIVQANSEFAEKIVASHFALLQALFQKSAVPDNFSSEQTWSALSEKGNLVADYYKACLKDGLDYQQQVLAA